ncbi:hypothetical protein GCM10028895_05140 [Pontibacter rugosus]
MLQKSEAEKDVSEVRQYISQIQGFKSVKVIEREKNLGLATSIIQGVTEVVNIYGRVIVLEDDLVTAPSFLSYMNTALKLYQQDDAVISVHGYVYPANINLVQNTFSLKVQTVGVGQHGREVGICLKQTALNCCSNYMHKS